MHQACAADWTFLNSVDEVIGVIREVDSPQVKIILDTYHLGFNSGLVDRIAEIAPHIAIVQLGDARFPPRGEQNRCRLGEGIIPLYDIVAALKTTGYDGYYDVELLGEDLESFEYASMLEHAKNFFARLVNEIYGHRNKFALSAKTGCRQSAISLV